MTCACFDNENCNAYAIGCISIAATPNGSYCTYMTSRVTCPAHGVLVLAIEILWQLDAYGKLMQTHTVPQYIYSGCVQQMSARLPKDCLSTATAI